MNGPRRREKPKPHLDAAVVPVERALLARAAEMENGSAVRKAARIAGVAPDSNASKLIASMATVFAAEFRTLAEELHYW